MYFYLLLNIILGYTFVIKIMEKGEEDAQGMYSQLAEEVPEAQKSL